MGTELTAINSGPVVILSKCFGKCFSDFSEKANKLFVMEVQNVMISVSIKTVTIRVVLANIRFRVKINVLYIII